MFFMHRSNKTSESIPPEIAISSFLFFSTIENSEAEKLLFDMLTLIVI
jgi:hypothetical protein